MLNGRFYAAAPSGVHRVAEEIVHAVDALLVARPALDARYAIELLLPRDALRCPLLRRIGVRTCGRFSGRLWEQCDLPLHAAGGVVLSLCNLGPAISRCAVTMIHDAQVHSSPSSYGLAFRLWYRLVQPILGRRHLAILTVSAYSRAEIARFGIAPYARVRVVWNGANHMDRIVASRRVAAAHGLRRGRYVLAMATTTVHKNIAVLLEAFSGRGAPGVELALCGTATRADFERAGVAVPPGVRFLGRVDDANLKGLLEDAHCLAFPSLTEGFGLPPIEAMRVGCPVVAAPNGALPEICADAALFADPAEPQAWLDAFGALAADRALRARAIALGRANAERFSWAHAGMTTLDIVTGVAHG